MSTLVLFIVMALVAMFVFFLIKFHMQYRGQTWLYEYNNHKVRIEIKSEIIRTKVTISVNNSSVLETAKFVKKGLVFSLPNGETCSAYLEDVSSEKSGIAYTCTLEVDGKPITHNSGNTNTRPKVSAITSGSTNKSSSLGKKSCTRCGGIDTMEVSPLVRPGVWWCSDCKKDFVAR